MYVVILFRRISKITVISRSASAGYIVLFQPFGELERSSFYLYRKITLYKRIFLEMHILFDVDSNVVLTAKYLCWVIAESKGGDLVLEIAESQILGDAGTSKLWV